MVASKDSRSAKGDPPLHAMLRKEDYERYLFSLFIPTAERHFLWAILAFSLETAKIPEKVSEEMVGMIRLAWWRERVDDGYANNTPRPHEIVRALHDALREYRPPRDYFEEILEARAMQLDPVPFHSESAFYEFHSKTSGAINRLYAKKRGISGELLEQASRLGATYGAIGYLRSAASLFSHGSFVLFPPENTTGKQLLSSRPENVEQLMQPVFTSIVDTSHNQLADLADIRKASPYYDLQWSTCRWWVRRLQNLDTTSIFHPVLNAPLPFLPQRLFFRRLLARVGVF
jgi:hypothetical protein